MSAVIYFDIETNSLLDNLNEIYCLCIIDEKGNELKYKPHEIDKGVQTLTNTISCGFSICGHNIINFDLIALERLYGFTVPNKNQVIDTLVLSRAIYPNIEVMDSVLLKNNKLPSKLFKSHSLSAWGYRLGELKGTYGATEGAWDKYTEDMLLYCMQDVRVTKLLHERLLTHKYPQNVIKMEHDIQWLMTKQELNGFPFDIKKAQELEAQLRARQAVIQYDLLRKAPQIPDKLFVPKRDNSKLGYKKGIPIQRYKELNPNSRQQIKWLLNVYYGYTPNNPDLYEDNNELKLDEETFNFIKTDTKAPKEVQELACVFSESLLLTKRLGQLADGKHGWLKCVSSDNRIHGHVNPCGTVTGRASHSSPNIAQVPSVVSMYGKECRELFKANDDWYQVGVDVSGLELRCLAHYMYPYDKGAYAHAILNGDIHTTNQLSAGLPTRADAKRFVYAYLYGAGDQKIGSIINGDSLAGKRIKRKFLEKTPALAKLKKAIEGTLIAESYQGKVVKWKRKYLIGIDGRPLYVRSIHSALNMLLQSAGASICKQWCIRTEERLVDICGLHHGKDFQFVAWVHDEFQCLARTKEIAELIVTEAQQAIRDTQELFNFRVQLDTEGKVGKNWYDCH